MDKEAVTSVGGITSLLTNMTCSRFTLVLQDLNRQVVQTSFATVSIPELEFEVPPSTGGSLFFYIHRN